MKIDQAKEPTGGARLLIDIGPLLVFFLVNFLAPVPSAIKIFVATIWLHNETFIKIKPTI